MGLRRRSCEGQITNNKIQITKLKKQKTKSRMDYLLEMAIKAAIDAGKKILEIYASPDLGIENKEDLTPITRADKAAHEIIIEQLTSTGIPILSEEGKTIPWEIRKTWNKYWLVDPLDGTKEFIKRNGEFTVNIALIEKGTPVAGVIVVPVSGELFYANINGSFRCSIDFNGETNINHLIKNSIKLPYKKSGTDWVVAGSRSHINPETDEFILTIDTKGKPLKRITKGSSLKFCMVASGEADIYPRLGPTMEWDIAAGHAIALFAGKSITQYPSGEPVVYNKKHLQSPWFVVR
jgi:3'(2'), 5'-bisphosphate nucleotidase